MTRKRLGEAFDLGGNPDVINSERKQQFAQRTHVLGRHPAFPSDEDTEASNYEEKLASPMYIRAMQKLQKYTGRRLSSVGGIVQAFSIALRTALQIEADHREELEALAVRLVLELPEFASVKDAADAGDLNFDVAITEDIDNPEMSMSGDEPNESEEDELVNMINNVDAERSKRLLVNAMISGAAESYNYAFELYNSELEAIDKRLPTLYGLIMAGTDLGYWIMPDSAVSAAVKTGAGQGGESSIKNDEDGTPTVHAHGVVFPILVHEIVKSLVEYLSYDGLPKNNEVRQRTLKRTDHTDYETAGLMMGPEIWNRIKTALGKQQRLLPDLYDALVQLEPDEFNEAVHTLLKGGEKASRLATTIVNNARQESMTNTDILTRVLNGESARTVVETTVTAPAKPGTKTEPDTDTETESPKPNRGPWRRREVDPNSAPKPKSRLNARVCTH